MANWVTAFQNIMYSAFHIPPSMVVPALFSLLMVVGIVALILYEAFKKITDNESAAGWISVLVAFAIGGYMLYNGSILVIAGFGTLVIISILVLFFIALGVSFWHKHAKGYYQEKKSTIEARKEYKRVKHEETEEAVKTIEEFWEAERKAADAVWLQLKRIRKIDESNITEATQTLNNIIVNTKKEVAVCEKWSKYFKREFGRWSPEVKFIDKLIRGWETALSRLENALGYLRSGNYSGAMNEIAAIIGQIKSMRKTTTKGENETEKKEGNTKTTKSKGVKLDKAQLNKEISNLCNVVRGLNPRLSTYKKDLNSKVGNKLKEIDKKYNTTLYNVYSQSWKNNVFMIKKFCDNIDKIISKLK